MTTSMYTLHLRQLSLPHSGIKRMKKSLLKFTFLSKPLTIFFHYSTSPAAIRLRVGSTRRDSGGRIVRVASVIVHPQYGRPQFDNDIAVLRLARPLTFNANIRAIKLPQPRQPVPLVRLTVTGWGLTAVSVFYYLLLTTRDCRLLNYGRLLYMRVT